MAKMYYENDADMSLLEGKTVGVIGYGSQGHAHALNLKDSGVDVVVGLYEGSSSKEKAEGDGLRVELVADAARDSDIVMMLIPDHMMAEVYGESISPHMEAGKTLMFAHGFNIHYETIMPPSMRWTCRWSRRKRPATACARCSREAPGCRGSSRFTRTPPAWPTTWG